MKKQPKKVSLSLLQSKLAQEQVRKIRNTGILPDKREVQQIGVISDLHLGSKYCMRSQLVDCVTRMYADGIREILIPGDLLDGCYNHGQFELKYSGLEDQTKDLFDTLPRAKGLTYHAITGNHDETFAAKSGADVGQYITGVFRDGGRDDLKFYGRCGAHVRIRGAIVHMWHPLKGPSYARSYGLQKQIENGYGAGGKPDILLAGHWHQFAAVEERGIFAIACPTFQSSGSAFSHRIGTNPSLGGVVLQWKLAGRNMVREVTVSRRRYFEVETLRHIKEDGYNVGS